MAVPGLDPGIDPAISMGIPASSPRMTDRESEFVWSKTVLVRHSFRTRTGIRFA